MLSVLVLNVDYLPLEVVPWQRAMVRLLDGKVELIEQYVGKVVRTPSREFPFPAVVRIAQKYVRRRARLSRANLLARDGYTCQYCGRRPRKSTGAPRLEELTLDHVVPRAQAAGGWVVLPWNGERVRLTSWRNLVACCSACNGRKGARVPRAAGMILRKYPRIPTMLDIAWMSVARHRIPDEWKDYLPEGSPWEDYWDVELQD